VPLLPLLLPSPLLLLLLLLQVYVQAIQPGMSADESKMVRVSGMSHYFHCSAAVLQMDVDDSTSLPTTSWLLEYTWDQG
jgi:hypothetical protein